MILDLNMTEIALPVCNEDCISRRSLSKSAEIELCIRVGAWVAMFSQQKHKQFC